MSGNNIILDTNIILYLFGGDRTLLTFLEDKEMYLSFITELEVLGYHSYSIEKRKEAKEFLKQCHIIDINEDIKQKTIQIRQQNKIKLPDAIIAATAMCLDYPLITADKALKNIKGLDIALYEQ
jgi:predicted nucleic acid-binding protein